MNAIHLRDNGGGYPVLLLHGFPFNHTIWDTYRKKLDSHYRVITPDLPGFGKSDLGGSAISISEVASRLIRKLQEMQINECVVVGHSLGGYVALAMASQQPDMFSGIVLFHSTSNPDNDEKKENRNKLIDFVKKNGAEAFTGKFVAPLFSSPEHPGVKTSRDIAIQAKGKSVIAYLEAMRDRPDTSQVLRSFHGEILIISGENDSAIPVESLKKLTGLSPKIKLEIIKDIGHMGMFEAPEKTAEIIDAFLRNVTGSKQK